MKSRMIHDTWYVNNRDILAAYYFGDIPCTRYAIEMLGFPQLKCLVTQTISITVPINLLAPGFNPPYKH
jgi:hypothetical protein